MTDSLVTLPGTGQDVATDLIAAKHYQYMKLSYGASGAFTAVDASNPLPVTDAAMTSGNQTVKVVNGANTAAVKAASTASAGTDPALVVALSPNNTIGLALDATITGGTQRSKVTDGTNNAAVKAASTAALATDPALVVALSPNNTVGVTGTVTANVGTTGGLALDATITGGTQQSKITDGTNVATVKAASTAAVATDKAVVVAISPNNSPTVTANIGTSGSLALDATITGGTARTKVTDGTNNAAVKAASTAAVATDPALVVVVSPNNNVGVTGTVTANIGTSGSLALDATLTGGTQRTKVTDGTNNAAVKAASTAAATTDPALVVAVSPNAGVKVFDGTNTAAVKAASTAAATTDPALVVALSPNSGVLGTVAHDGVDAGAPVKVGAKAINAWTTAVSNLDRADAVSDLLGRRLMAFKPNELQKSFSKTYTTTQTGDALWTPASGKRIVVTHLTLSTTSTTAGRITAWFGASADTTYNEGTDQPLDAINFIPSASASPGARGPFLDPVVCLNADYVLRVTSSAAVNFTITVHGYEI